MVCLIQVRELIPIREIVQQFAALRWTRRRRCSLGCCLIGRSSPPAGQTAETFARIGWKPQVSLPEGLERTVDWYKGNGNVFADVQRPSWLNLVWKPRPGGSKTRGWDQRIKEKQWKELQF